MSGWEPLAPANPVPGDPAVSARAGTYYTGIADDMARAYAALGVIGDLEGFESKAVDALSQKAEDVRGEVRKAQSRYAAAGAALSTYAVHHQEAQDKAAALLVKARNQQTAVAETSRQLASAQTDQSDALVDSRSTGVPVDYAVTASLHHAQAAHADAVGTLQTLVGELPEIVSTLHAHAHTAAEAINEAVDADGLTDGWWEHWGSKVAHFLSKWAGYVSLYAGLASLVLGWVPILGQVIMAVALVSTIVATVADFALVLAGEGSLVTLGLDVLGLVSLGLGKVVGNAGKALATKGLAQGLTRSSRVLARASKLGNPADRTLARTVWANAGKGFKTVEAHWYNPVSWFKSGGAQFKGLGVRGGFMVFLGQSESAHVYQMLRNAGQFDKFAQNATAFTKTMSHLGSLNPAKLGSLGSALVPYALTAIGAAPGAYAMVKGQ